MKIYFSTLHLNGGSESPKDVCADAKRRTQTEYPIDASTAKLFDRKNARYALSFSLERSHESESEAEIFALTHASQVAALSPATLEFAGDNGSVLFSNAALERIKTQCDGIMTVSKYEFAAPAPERSL